MRKSKVSPPDVFKVCRLLIETYPDARTELTYSNEWELLIAVMLSAQCTDARVNLTTPHLFRRFPSPQSLAAAKPGEVESLIRSCGFFRQKAKSIQSASKDLVERFGGKVPDTLEELTTLRGVGRKTASVVLNQAFDIPAIAVDTHVKRVSLRLGWATQSTPEKIEFELRNLLPMEYWSRINGMLILHGRRICRARKPDCEHCPLSPYCQYYRLRTKTKAPDARVRDQKLPGRPARNRAFDKGQKL